jgi:exodeoxyribonuclease VII large subunit
VLAALESARTQLAGLARSTLFREPRQRVEQAAQRLDAIEQALTRSASTRLTELRQQVASVEAALRHHRPDQQLALLRERLAALASRLSERAARQLQRHRERTKRTAEMLRLLSPKSTLQRGYSLTTNAGGQLVRSVADLQEGTPLLTELADGKFESIVRTVRKAKRQKSSKVEP